MNDALCLRNGTILVRHVQLLQDASNPRKSYKYGMWLLQWTEHHSLVSSKMAPSVSEIKSTDSVDHIANNVAQLKLANAVANPQEIKLEKDAVSDALCFIDEENEP